MKKRTDQLGADILGGSYTKWLDQTLELVKPPDPPPQETVPKLQPPKIEAPKLTQPTPTQINREDTAKTQPQTQAVTPEKKWNEVTLEKPSVLPPAPITRQSWEQTRRPASSMGQRNKNGYVPTSPLRDIDAETPPAITLPKLTRAQQAAGWTDQTQYSPEYFQSIIDATQAQMQSLQAEIDAQETENASTYGERNRANTWARRAMGLGGGRYKAKAEDADRKLSQGREKTARLQKGLEGLETQIAQAQWSKEVAEYEPLRQNPDFEGKSVYKPNRGKPIGQIRYASLYDPELGISNMVIADSGYEDITYDAINGDKNARLIASQIEGSTYEDVPETVVRMFDYLYETQGKKAAYAYMDLIADRQYSALTAMGMGMAKGIGATSLSKAMESGMGYLTGHPEAGDQFAEDLDRYQEQLKRQHPVAYSVGDVGGTVSLATGMGALGSTTANAAGVGETGTAVISGATAFGGTTAMQELGDVSAGGITPEEYALSVAGSAAGGTVGSLAAQGATRLGEAALDKASKVLGQEWIRHNIFTNAINQGVGGAAFSVGNAVTRGAIDPNYDPTADELARDAAVSFAFQAITSAARLAGRTDQAKAALEQDVETLRQDFETIAKAKLNGEITPTDTIERMKLRSATLRVTIEGTRYIGQGKKVDEALAFLDQMDDFLAEAAKYNDATMLGSGAGFDARQTATTSEVTQDGADVVGVDGGAPDATTTSTHQEDLEQLAKRYGVAYTDTARYALLARYQESVMEGWLSPLVDFTLYEDYYQKIQDRIIGRVVGDIEIKTQTQHFSERLFGCMEDPKTNRPRSGVALEDIFDCIENPVRIRPIVIDEDGLPSFQVEGRRARISINPDDGTLIQVNPWRGKKNG